MNDTCAVIGPCDCGGYGIVYNEETRAVVGKCHDPLKPPSLPQPFAEIDLSLLNDHTDCSTLTVDGLSLMTVTEYDYVPGMEKHPQQEEIHEKLQRICRILSDYRDGVLKYD